MNREQAKKLIRDTFESSFDKEKFVVFIKNLLNCIDYSHFDYYGKYIPDSYKEHISKYERIGKYRDGENRIDILIVHLKRETSIERARSMQRNFISGYLKGNYGSSKEKDAALVAFVSPNEEDWRFSLVKMDYRFDEGPSGRVKIKEEFTPARRWSFLVGNNEKSHTAQSRLVSIIEDDEHNPTLSQLEEAFNIEPVTKEFFNKYRNLLIRSVDALDKIVENDWKIQKDFKSKNINTVDFTKKLLGQIVFLYFLQKKGWFGVSQDKEWGEGDKNFIRNLFEKCKKEGRNFFNDYLEELFYNALNNPRTDQVDPTWSKFFNCKIPFLNGGLFEPIVGYDWVHTNILLPNELFSNNRRTFEGDIGDGILDVFDRFNFTVKEDEPLEKEVAIDPELLGKLYEKFNAIRADNFYEYKKALASSKKHLEKQFNKKFGVYYTPREIVHYMCQQSLINYLYTFVNQEVIKKPASTSTQLKLLGPDEPEQLRFRTEDEMIKKQDFEALIKRGEQLVENELVVQLKEERIGRKEQKTTSYTSQIPSTIKYYAQEIDNSLKNIKICDPAVGSGAFLVGMMSEIVKTRYVLSIFVNEPGRNVYDFKRECIENSLYGIDIDPGACEIAKLRLWLSIIVDEENIQNIKPLPNLDYKIVCGNSLLGVEKDLFNDKLFNQLEKLKPLYFNETNPTKKQEYKKHIEDLISKITNGHKEFDFEVYFSEVFHQKDGFDVVIANPPYVNLSNLTMRDREIYKRIFTITKNKVDLYAFFIELGNQILKEEGVLTYIVPHTWKATTSFSKLRELIFSKFELKIIVELDYGAFEATVKPVVIILQKNKKQNYQISVLNPNFEIINKIYVKEVLQNSDFTLDTLSTSTEKSLFRKIEKDTIPLGKVCKFTRGIKTSNDKRFVKREKLNGEYKRVIRGRNVDRYFYQWDGEYIWYRPDLMKEKVGSLPHTRELFEVPEKLILQRISKGLAGSYDDQEIFALDTCLVSDVKTLKSQCSLKFILALINSRLLNFWYHKKFALPTVSGYELHQLPIKQVRLMNQKSLANLVDEILSLTKSEDYLENPQKQAKVKEYEHRIDQLVYKLYELTYEEIKIVERE